MRIIAGDYARMTLLGPVDRTTRPITDRVKESLFSILGDRVKGCVAADLFCGTGSMGLEAVSRGASLAIMVDLNRQALERLGKNISKMGVEDRAIIRRTDIFRTGIPAVPQDRKCDLIFVDPPYKLSEQTGPDSAMMQLLSKIAAQAASGAMVMVRQECRAEPIEPVEGMVLAQRRTYGNMLLSFFETTVT